MATIVVPAKGQADPEVVTLAEQALADVTALESGTGGLVAGAGLTLTGSTLDVVANGDGSIVVNANDIQLGTVSEDKIRAGLAALSAPATFNAAQLQNVHSIYLSATSSAGGLFQSQDPSGSGSAMTISAQQGASGNSGGDLVLSSGLGGTGSDPCGSIYMGMGYDGSFAGGFFLSAGSEGTVITVGYSGASGTSININSSVAATIIFGTAAIQSTLGSNIALMSDGTKRIEMNATGLGFFAATPIAKPTVSGGRLLPEEALANLLQALEDLGLINDTTTVS